MWLGEGRLVTLVCPEVNVSAMGHALNLLICNPVETSYLRSYARVQATRRIENNIEADIELAEAVQ
jgi:hypothetical protein